MGGGVELQLCWACSLTAAPAPAPLPLHRFQGVCLCGSNGRWQAQASRRRAWELGRLRAAPPWLFGLLAARTGPLSHAAYLPLPRVLPTGDPQAQAPLPGCAPPRLAEACMGPPLA